ncbi:MAG: Spy/CpxP family protein refolding chaperone [Gammaproteobacteria bacterium]|nr:Spy/CpxP family protein refolding chaperone [Gammaproteobacteria bacterium]
MNKRIWIQDRLAKLLIVSVFFTAIPAYADDDRHRGMMKEGDYREWKEHYREYGMPYNRMGMMGGYAPLGMLNLNDKQWDQVSSIQRQQRNKHIDMMKDMWDRMDNINKLMLAESRDPKTIVKAYEPIFAIKRRMIESRVETMNKVDALLTSEQKQELRKYRRRGMRFGMMGYGH